MFNIPFIQIPFGWVMTFFYNFFENYGVALILLSLVIKLLLLPMSMKSKKSMMKMSRLQPRLKQIELACGDDKQKYSAEVQQLYKDEGVSMFGGCLWSFLPLIILFPLYNVIREPLTYILHVTKEQLPLIQQVVDPEKTNAYWQYLAASNIETYGAGIVDNLKNLNLTFLGIDLGQTPQWKFWTLSGWSQIGGFLFPLLSGGLNYLSVFISQKMNNTVISDENGEHDEAAAKAAGTGKFMNILMPLMSVWFGFIMPLGISVYWIAQSVFGIIQDALLTLHYRKVYDAEDKVRQAKAAERAEEEAEKERVRAAKRAANPEGIVENTSKKKKQMREKQEREAAAREFEEKNQGQTGETEEDVPGSEPYRPFAHGRAYAEDHYEEETEKPDEPEKSDKSKKSDE